MDQKDTLVTRLFEVTKKSWNDYEGARRDGDIQRMRSSYDEVTRLLRILHISGCQSEVTTFLRQNEMPVRAILAKIAQNGQ
ncbi:MAG: hypothetical protein HYW90_03525 [Candidatus Sungbacteria bacterium]|nr:hypothetical protein [Candidatus Sungbacteria bacterium]